MRFYFHPEAREEFDGAVDFYEQSQTGLGLEFAEEVWERREGTLMKIETFGKDKTCKVITGKRNLGSQVLQ